LAATFTTRSGGTSYRRWTQITQQLNDLEVAWRFKTDNLGPFFPDTNWKDAADGQRCDLYDRARGGPASSANAQDAVADWVHRFMKATCSRLAAAALRAACCVLTNRNGDERVIYMTTAIGSSSLDAKRAPLITFVWTNGVVYLSSACEGVVIKSI